MNGWPLDRLRANGEAKKPLNNVIPVKTGIQKSDTVDSGFRRNDDWLAGFPTYSEVP